MAGGPAVGGATRLVGILGWPVEHSLSPVIHNAAFEAVGLAWTYLPLPVPPGGLPGAVRGLVALGFAGANVTMPHKEEAAALCDSLAGDAELLQAVNTLLIGPDGVVGHNTDARGFARFLAHDAGFDAAGRTALLVGAGGAARACALALARAGLAELTVAVRDPVRAGALIRAVGAGPGAEVRVVPLETATGARADLVVNATPLGVGAAPPVPHPVLRPGTVVVDLSYGRAPSRLVVDARSAGAQAHDGLGMLLSQAALSFELWTGRAAPREVMARAATEALARS